MNALRAWFWHSVPAISDDEQSSFALTSQYASNNDDTKALPLIQHGLCQPLISGAEISVDNEIERGCLAWYQRFLTARISEVPSTLLQILDSKSASSTDRFSTERNFCNLLSAISQKLHEAGVTSNPTMSDIGSALKKTPGMVILSADEDKSKLNQIIFMAIGWLTMFYDPVTTFNNGTLAISRTLRMSSKNMISSSLRRYEQDYSLVEYSLLRVLSFFGDVIPLSKPLTRTPDRLEVRFLNYFTLTRVALVEIEWVDHLNAHLEFNDALKTLKLFRFPSFCKLLCSSDQKSIVHRLFRENAVNRDDEDGDREEDQADAGKFALEVLMSYRLIFGQDEKSWNAYKKEKVGSDKTTGLRLPDHDDLLDRLCGHNWRKEANFYSALNPLDAIYPPSSQMPYLGERLLRLQNFCEAENPQSWSILWQDRRNLLQYYTFWSFIYVAILTTCVGIAQIILAAAALGR